MCLISKSSLCKSFALILILYKSINISNGQNLKSFEEISKTINNAKKGNVPAFTKSVGPIELPKRGKGKKINLGGEFTYNPPNSFNVAGTASIPLGFDATYSMGFIGSRVDEIYLNVNTEKPLFGGIYLYSLGGGVGNLTGNYVIIKANMSAGVGPSVFPNPFKGELFPVLHATAETEIHSNGYFRLDGRGYIIGFETGGVTFLHVPKNKVHASAWFKMLDGVISADGNLNYYMRPKILAGGAQVRVGTPRHWPIIGGITLAKAWFNGRFNIPVGYVKLNGGIRILFLGADITYYNKPQNTIIVDLGWLWGRHIIKFDNYQHITDVNYAGDNIVEWKSTDDFIRMYKSFYKEWEIPFVFIEKVPETGGFIILNKNFDRIDRYESNMNDRVIKMGPNEDTVLFKLSSENQNKKVVFRLNYQNETLESPRVSLEMPDGNILKGEEGGLPDGYNNNNKLDEPYAFSNSNPIAKEAFFSIREAQVGNYAFKIEGIEKIGEYTVEVYSQDEIANIDMVIASESVNRDGTVNTDMFEIEWIGNDVDSPDAMVEFYIDTDNQVPNGFKASEKKLSEFKEIGTYTFPTDHLDVEPGWYYVYMLIDDGRNSPTIKYADQKIWIDKDNAPKPIESYQCESIVNGFNITWEDEFNVSEDISYYEISYGEEKYGEIEYEMQIAHHDEKTKSINNLKSGQPYLVSVSAVNSEGVRSGKKVIKRVVPKKTIGVRRPIINSLPIENATVGRMYHYQPSFFDSDTQMASKFKNVLIENTKYNWELIKNPDGMIIDESTGLISWKPDVRFLKKDVNVIIQLTKNGSPILYDGKKNFNLYSHPITVKQDYKINVDVLPLPQANVLIYSRPFLNAVRGQEYQYNLKYNQLDNLKDSDFTLLEGPFGMQINDNKITWDVPNNAHGEYVKLLIETNSGKKYTQDYYLDIYNPLTPSDSPEIISVSHNDGIYKILFKTELGKKYVIEAVNSINDEKWQQIKDYSGKENGYIIHEETSGQNAAKFFRIREK